MEMIEPSLVRLQLASHFIQGEKLDMPEEQRVLE